MHALHNASLIRKLLPRTLTAPAPLFADRRARHYELAALLRVSQADKREKTEAKKKATRETNKAKKAARGQPTAAARPHLNEEAATEVESEEGGNEDIEMDDVREGDSTSEEAARGGKTTAYNTVDLAL